MEVGRLEAPYPSDCLDLTSEKAAKYSAYSEMYNVNYDIHVSFHSNFCTLIFSNIISCIKCNFIVFLESMAPGDAKELCSMLTRFLK